MSHTRGSAAKPHPPDPSKHEIINGKKYDKELITISKKVLKDGHVELSEAKKLWASAMDGKRVTKMERKTLLYILREHKKQFDDNARVFLLSKLGFVEINGVRYEKDLLALAKESMKDGCIELEEAKKLWKSAMDGKKLTATEARTLRYIVNEPTMKVKKDAKEWLEKKLGEAVIEPDVDEDGFEDEPEEAPAPVKTVIEVDPFDPLAKLMIGPGRLKADRGYVLQAVKIYGLALAFASEQFRADRELVLEAVKSNGLALKYASEDLRGDARVILEAVNSQPGAIQFATEEMKGNRKCMIEVVQLAGSALRYASEALRADKELVLEALKNDGAALEFAAEELKSDKELVTIAVTNKGPALKFASDVLKEDRELVMVAVKSNGSALEFASEDLKADRDFALELVQNKAYALLYIAEELKADREIVLEAVRQDEFMQEYASDDLKVDQALTKEARAPSKRRY